MCQAPRLQKPVTLNSSLLCLHTANRQARGPDYAPSHLKCSELLDFFGAPCGIHSEQKPCMPWACRIWHTSGWLLPSPAARSFSSKLLELSGTWNFVSDWSQSASIARFGQCWPWTWFGRLEHSHDLSRFSRFYFICCRQSRSLCALINLAISFSTLRCLFCGLENSSFNRSCHPRTSFSPTQI